MSRSWFSWARDHSRGHLSKGTWGRCVPTCANAGSVDSSAPHILGSAHVPEQPCLTFPKRSTLGTSGRYLWIQNNSTSPTNRFSRPAPLETFRLHLSFETKNAQNGNTYETCTNLQSLFLVPSFCGWTSSENISFAERVSKMISFFGSHFISRWISKHKVLAIVKYAV